MFEVSKKSMTISDPVNGNTNPKSIPGAILEYATKLPTQEKERQRLTRLL